jgi:hypothetical protein
MMAQQQHLGGMARGDGDGMPPSGEPSPNSSSGDQAPQRKSLVEVIAELNALLSGLRDALRHQAAPPTPRMAYREREIPPLLGISLRLWQRAIHLGEAPQADIRIGRVKLWSHERLAAWTAEQAPTTKGGRS